MTLATMMRKQSAVGARKVALAKSRAQTEQKKEEHRHRKYALKVLLPETFTECMETIRRAAKRGETSTTLTLWEDDSGWAESWKRETPEWPVYTNPLIGRLKRAGFHVKKSGDEASTMRGGIVEHSHTKSLFLCISWDKNKRTA